MDSQGNGASDLRWLGVPIDARALFEAELAKLLSMLRGLKLGDWSKVAVPGWTVHSLVAHVLGDYCGRLGRDTNGRRLARTFAPGETLEAFIHRINQEWVDAHAGVRPASLIEALATAGPEVTRHFQSVDLETPSLGVSWAGVDPAPMWLDTAREFTEYWTHRQQIRHATGQGTDPEPCALRVVLDTFMRALPHALRNTPAPAGTQVQIIVDGLADGTWTVTATQDRWSLAQAPKGQRATTVMLDSETAWRLCTRGIEPGAALALARINGERRLAEAACQIVSIVY